MRKIITIKTNEGDKQIKAETRGLYAIHPTSVRYSNRKMGWTVTHVESGMSIVDQLETRKIARNFLTELKKTGIDCNDFIPGKQPSLSPVRIKLNKNIIVNLIKKFRSV